MSVSARPGSFLEYEPLLWRVLGVLARDGYAVLPQDARDIIHDFFLEWDPLTARFDPDKGEFAPYLATSFYRFGRRRQLQLHRLRARAIDFEECIALASTEPEPPDTAARNQQRAQLQRTIAKLPPAEQAMLAEFLSEYAPAEREMAHKRGLTRYRLREQLAAAISRVALQLMDEAPQSADAGIAYRVWVADQAPRCVAAELGLSTEQVNEAKSRFAQALLNSVRGGEGPHRAGRNIMPDLDLLRNALTAFNDNDTLERLKAHAPGVRAALEQQDVVLNDEEIAALEQHPDWLAKVYAALGAGTEEEARDDEGRKLAVILSDEQTAMADAWTALLDKLDAMRAPASPGPWELPLKAVERPDAALLQHLRGQPSCRAGDPASERLLQYGLTPAMLFEALHRMELLFNRTLRRAGSEPPKKVGKNEVLLVRDGKRSAAIAAPLLEAQLAGTLDLASGMAAPLARSLSHMLQVSPLLVNGYCQNADNTFVKLPETERFSGFLSSGQLIQRWCATQRDIEPIVSRL